MIPSLFRQRLLKSRYAAYCTTVSRRSAHNLRTDSHRDTKTLRQAQYLGSELSDAECRRESRQTLTGSRASTRERNAGRRSEDYSEFLICKRRQRETSSVSVCEQRNAALERQTVEEKKVSQVGSCDFL